MTASFKALKNLEESSDPHINDYSNNNNDKKLSLLSGPKKEAVITSLGEFPLYFLFFIKPQYPYTA